MASLTAYRTMGSPRVNVGLDLPVLTESLPACSFTCLILCSTCKAIVWSAFQLQGSTLLMSATGGHIRLQRDAYPLPLLGMRTMNTNIAFGTALRRKQAARSGAVRSLRCVLPVQPERVPVLYHDVAYKQMEGYICYAAECQDFVGSTRIRHRL